MKKRILYTFSVCVSLLTLSCSNNFDEGQIDWDSLKGNEKGEINYTLDHPCLLHTQKDFDFVKSKLTEEPWKSGLAKLQGNSYAKSTHKGNPQEIFDRSNSDGDGQAAYMLALQWKLGQGEAYGDAALGILNGWAQKCTSVKLDKGDDILSVLFYGYQYANAAEIMRGYSKWNKEDFAKFQKWMKEVILPPVYKFLSNRTTQVGHGWISWEATANLTILSIGVLCDDDDLIKFSINYFYNGDGPGSAKYMVVNRHEDPAGLLKGKNLVQSQEMGRDQGHGAIAVPILGTFCQSAYNIGIDLFAYNDNMVLGICEYFAKYNVSPDVPVVMPFTPYYTTQDGGKTFTEIAPKGRGETRPGWELIYNHYNKIKGLETPYSAKFAEKVRPEGNYKDFAIGGKGDQLGSGTLMYTR